MYTSIFLRKWVSPLLVLTAASAAYAGEGNVHSGILCRTESARACETAVSALTVVAASETEPSDISVGPFVVSYTRSSATTASFKATTSVEGRDVQVVAGELERDSKKGLLMSVLEVAKDEKLLSGLREAGELAAAVGHPDFSSLFLVEETETQTEQGK